MPKKSNVSSADVLIGQAALDLRKDLYETWKKVTTGRNVETEAFREFFAPFTRYAEALLRIEVEKISRLPLGAVCSKINGYWPDGRPEGRGLRIDIVNRIAPEPPVAVHGKTLQNLMALRLSNPHFFDKSRERAQTPTAFVKAAADAGIENDSNIFETLRSLPQLYLGDWFRHLSGTWGMFRNPSGDNADKAKTCGAFSLVMLDRGVWCEFLDTVFSPLCVQADNLVNKRALREMEQRATPRRGNLDTVWVRSMVEILASERQNPAACVSLDRRQIKLPARVTWNDQDGHPATGWVKSFEGSRGTVEAYLSKFRKRHATK